MTDQIKKTNLFDHLVAFYFRHDNERLLAGDVDLEGIVDWALNKTDNGIVKLNAKLRAKYGEDLDSFLIKKEEEEEEVVPETIGSPITHVAAMSKPTIRHDARRRATAPVFNSGAMEIEQLDNPQYYQQQPADDFSSSPAASPRLNWKQYESATIEEVRKPGSGFGGLDPATLAQMQEHKLKKSDDLVEMITIDGVSVCTKFRLDTESTHFGMCKCGNERKAHVRARSMRMEAAESQKLKLQCVIKPVAGVVESPPIIVPQLRRVSLPPQLSTVVVNEPKQLLLRQASTRIPEEIVNNKAVYRVSLNPVIHDNKQSPLVVKQTSYQQVALNPVETKKVGKQQHQEPLYQISALKPMDQHKSVKIPQDIVKQESKEKVTSHQSKIFQKAPIVEVVVSKDSFVKQQVSKELDTRNIEVLVEEPKSTREDVKIRPKFIPTSKQEAAMINAATPSVKNSVHKFDSKSKNVIMPKASFQQKVVKLPSKIKSSSPCVQYELDLHAAVFGTCVKCGWKKIEHNKNLRIRSKSIREDGPSEPCKHYQLDVISGACKCGFAKKDHLAMMSGGDKPVSSVAPSVSKSLAKHWDHVRLRHVELDF